MDKGGKRGAPAPHGEKGHRETDRIPPFLPKVTPVIGFTLTSLITDRRNVLVHSASTVGHYVAVLFLTLKGSALFTETRRFCCSAFYNHLITNVKSKTKRSCPWPDLV